MLARQDPEAQRLQHRRAAQRVRRGLVIDQSEGPMGGPAGGRATTTTIAAAAPARLRNRRFLDRHRRKLVEALDRCELRVRAREVVYEVPAARGEGAHVGKVQRASDSEVSLALGEGRQRERIRQREAGEAEGCAAAICDAEERDTQ